MARQFTEQELEAYLDEAMAPEDMAAVEKALRRRPELARQLAAIHARRDAGVHSIGEIWRRHRVSCPTRQQLGSFLLEALSADEQAYITFHLETIGCRFCRANLEDLKSRQEEAAADRASRHRRYFQSSAGYLRRGKR